VKFHDGSSLTPEDVEYSFERLLVQDRIGGPAWMLYEPLLGVYGAEGPYSDPNWGLKIDHAVESDATTVWFNLVSDFPSLTFRQILSQTWSSVVEKSWAVNEGDLNIAEVQGGWSNWESIYFQWHNPAVSRVEDAVDHALKDGGTGPYRISYMISYAWSVKAWNDHDNDPATPPLGPPDGY